MILCASRNEIMANHFDASIYMLSTNEGGRSKPIVSKYTQVLFSQTWSIPCRVDLRRFILFDLKNEIVYKSKISLSIPATGKEMLVPGEHANVRLTIFKKMVMNNGQTFTIREGHVTVATGIITSTRADVELPFNKLSKVDIKE